MKINPFFAEIFFLVSVAAEREEESEGEEGKSDRGKDRRREERREGRGG